MTSETKYLIQSCKAFQKGQYYVIRYFYLYLIILNGSFTILCNSPIKSKELTWLTRDNRAIQEVFMTSDHFGVKEKKSFEPFQTTQLYC